MLLELEAVVGEALLDVELSTAPLSFSPTLSGVSVPAVAAPAATFVVPPVATVLLAGMVTVVFDGMVTAGSRAGER